MSNPNPNPPPQASGIVKDVKIIVMGTPHTQSYKSTETLGEASLKSIKATHQAPEDLSKWELKTDAGAPLNFSDTFQKAGIGDKATLRLNRKSGTVAGIELE